MTSLPADPGLVLGNIVELKRIEQLQAIAQLQSPVDMANDRLNNLLLSNYKIQLIYQQMVNMKVDVVSLVKIQAEMVALKAEAADAAIDLSEQVMISEKAIRNLKAKYFKQTKISMQIESPMNFDLSEVKQFPLSFDSLKFDVQFFQVQKSADSSSAHAASVSSHVSAAFSKVGGPSVAARMGASAHTTTMNQTNTNSVDGTIVITAYATHKQTDIISPFVMDAEKAVRAWNWCNPKEQLSPDPKAMFAAALSNDEKPKGSLHLLSGVAKSSSFVGYVHILKEERTVQSSTSASVAASAAATMEANMGVAAMSGSFGVSSEVSSTVSSMLSTANLTSNCSLQCEGIIPSIVANDISTTVQNLKPDPSHVMAQLGAISNASSVGATGGMEGAAGNATTGAQFIQLNNSYITESISAVSTNQTLQNKVIDTNSMMTAFEDYVNKAIEGKCGVPSVFFIKDIKKTDVAKCYIRKFYPNGATNQKDAMAGQLGTTPTGANDGG